MRVVRTFKRLAAASIWGPDGVDENDDRVRLLLRFGLPAFDVACIIFGALGYLGGVPALRATFGETYAQSFGLTLAVTAFACLVGVAFPNRLWRVEYAGKCLLLGLLLLYAAAVIVAGVANGDLGRGAVGAAIVAMSVLPWWRITDIARDREVHQWR